jgi:hypothetical protein
MWVALHKFMEAMLGISMYGYLYPKLAITICLSYILLCFLFNKIKESRTGSAWMLGLGGGDSGKVTQTMCTHISKCKTDKIKEKNTLLRHFQNPWKTFM